MRFEELQAFEFAREDPSSGRRRPGRTLVVTLRGTHQGQRVVGAGEVPVPGWSTHVRERGYQQLDAVSGLLRDRTIDLTERDKVLPIGLRQLHDEVARSFAAVDRSSATLLESAVQTAILDAGARCLQRPMARLLGKRRRNLDAVAREVDVRGSRPHRIAARLAEGRSAPYLRLRIRGVNDEIPTLERATAELPKRPRIHLWLTISGPGSIDSLESFVGAIAASSLPRIASGGILVEPDRMGIPLVDLARLQSQADRQRENTATDRRSGSLRILASVDLGTEASHLDGLGNVVLEPARLGGPIATYDLACSLHECRPDLAVFVASTRAAGDLSKWMVRQVACSIPRLDGAAGAEPKHRGMGRAAAARHPLRGLPGFRRQQEPGLGAALDLAATSHLLEDYRSITLRSAAADTSVRPVPAAAGQEVARIKKWALDNHHLEREALASGLRTVRAGTQMFVADDPASQVALVFDMSVGGASSAVGRSLTVNKWHARRLLQRAGVPVAPGRAFDRGADEEVMTYAQELGYPLVVKPTGGSLGIGVTTNIRGPDQLRRALRHLRGERFGDTGILVERYIEGAKYRFYVLDGRVLSVLLGTPARVVGDGVHTVAELVAQKNLRRRNSSPYLGQRPLQLDSNAISLLRELRLSPNEIPTDGAEITLSTVINVAQGSDSFEVLDEVHPQILRLVSRTTSAIPGLPTGGVDVILEDHRRPADEQRMAVIEINSKAVLSIHQYPFVGTPRNVSREIVNWYRTRVGLGALTSWPDALRVRSRVSGRVLGVGYEEWVEAEAASVDVQVATRTVDEDLEVLLEGSTGCVAAVVARLLIGSRRSHPVHVTSEPLSPPAPDALAHERVDRTEIPGAPRPFGRDTR